MSFAYRDVSITDEHDSDAAACGETEQLSLLWHEQVEEAFRSCAAKPRRRRAPPAAPIGGGQGETRALVGARR
jgi:hypothetical protein